MKKQSLRLQSYSRITLERNTFQSNSWKCTSQTRKNITELLIHFMDTFRIAHYSYTILLSAVYCSHSTHIWMLAITFKEILGYMYTVQYTSIEPFSCSLLIKNQINCRKEAELKCKLNIVLKCSTSESWRLFCHSGLQRLTHVLQARPFLNACRRENTMWPTFNTIKPKHSTQKY